MSEKGWKALTIIGIWGGMSLVIAITGQVEEKTISLIATASVLIALFF